MGAMNRLATAMQLSDHDSFLVSWPTAHGTYLVTICNREENAANPYGEPCFVALTDDEELDSVLGFDEYAAEHGYRLGDTWETCEGATLVPAEYVL